MDRWGVLGAPSGDGGDPVGRRRNPATAKRGEGYGPPTGGPQGPQGPS